MTRSRHLATALAGWSVRHRAIAIAGWVLLVVVASMIGSAVGQKQMTMAEYAKGDSAKALQILDRAGVAQPAHELILVQGRTGTATSPGFRAAVAELIGGLQATGRVTGLREPYGAGPVSQDQHSVLVTFAMRGKAETAYERVQPVLDVVSQHMHVDMSTTSVMLLVGLAVGVDYCLFYQRRSREERAQGRDSATALRAAAATSGRSVLVSGLTVVVATSGMFLSGMLLFDGFGLAAILVVLVGMLGSVTVLPALLALGVPALSMHTEKLSIDKQLPADTSIMLGYHRIRAAFPGGPQPAQVLMQARDITAPQVQKAMADFTREAVRSGAANRPIQITVHVRSNVAEFTVPLAGINDATSTQVLNRLRSEVIPVTLAKTPGPQTYVAGDLAFSEDFDAAIHHSILPVLVFVLGFAFVLMVVAFRSVTIAAVSVLLNPLSLFASFGVIVAVFAVLSTLSMQDFKRLGVGLALAILLDATIVRAVLLPSVLSLLGERTWWLPGWLSFLTRSDPPEPVLREPESARADLVARP